MKKKLEVLAVILVFIFESSQVLAHGEDKAGPHGGFIRMPGAFHTEVVLDGDQSFKVFLLDMNWKNPSIKDSSLKVVIETPNKVFNPQCEPKADHYVCAFPQLKNLQVGKLEIQAQREGQKGNKAIYRLPLQLEKTDDGNHGHH